jgi:SAM-dependent methyltransferase
MHIPTNWRSWLEQWDKQQERYRPHREEGIQAIVSIVESVVTNGQGRVLDLACGCGSISMRLLAQLPHLDIVAADRDPVLLRITQGLFEDNPRVTVVETDLYKIDWTKVLGESRFDAVVTATSLHWLSAIDVQRIYHDLSTMLRPGGVFSNLDWMPIAHAPRIGAIADRYVQLHEAYTARMTPEIPSWDDWWGAAVNEPQLAEELARRQQLAGSPAEFMPAVDWHEQELLAAGFSEVAEVWRCFGSAVVTAVR